MSQYQFLRLEKVQIKGRHSLYKLVYIIGCCYSDWSHTISKIEEYNIGFKQG